MGKGKVHCEWLVLVIFLHKCRSSAQSMALPTSLPFSTGLLVLHWEANGSSSWGFNASVGSARCGSGGPGSCPVPQECVPQDGAAGAGLCRCPQGWAGPHCRMALCPENCNAHTGAGICNQVQVGQEQPGRVGMVVRAPLSCLLMSSEPRCVHLCRGLWWPRLCHEAGWWTVGLGNAHGQPPLSCELGNSFVCPMGHLPPPFLGLP